MPIAPHAATLPARRCAETPTPMPPCTMGRRLLPPRRSGVRPEVPRAAVREEGRSCMDRTLRFGRPAAERAVRLRGLGWWGQKAARALIRVSFFRGVAGSPPVGRLCARIDRETLLRHLRRRRRSVSGRGIQRHHAMCRHPLIKRGQTGPQQETTQPDAQHPQAQPGGTCRVRGWSFTCLAGLCHVLITLVQ